MNYDGDEPMLYVTAANAKRRSVSQGMKACAAVKLIPMFAGRWGGARKQAGNVSGLKGDSRDLAAKMLGVNAHYVSDALRLSKDDPKAFEEVWHDRIGLQSAISDVSGRKLAKDLRLDESTVRKTLDAREARSLCGPHKSVSSDTMVRVAAGAKKDNRAATRLAESVAARQVTDGDARESVVEPMPGRLRLHAMRLPTGAAVRPSRTQGRPSRQGGSCLGPQGLAFEAS